MAQIRPNTSQIFMTPMYGMNPPNVTPRVDTGGGGGVDAFVLQLGGLNLQLDGQDLTLGA